jgi:hypothetical protein
MGATAADWAGRPLLEYEGQYLEEAVAKRRAEAHEARSTELVIKIIAAVSLLLRSRCCCCCYYIRSVCICLSFSDRVDNATDRASTCLQMYGLGSCGDPLTPTPKPHSTWLNRRDVREALHATMPEHPWGERIGWDYTRTGASQYFRCNSEMILNTAI